MVRSGFFRRQDAVLDVAEGWDPDDTPGSGGWRQNIYSYPPIGDGAGGAHATTADLIAFLQALRAGRLLPPALTEAFLTPQARLREREGHQIWFSFGLQFDLDVDAGGVVRSYFKDGINAGASAILRYYPGPDLDVAVLANSEQGAWPVIDDVHSAVRALHPDVGDSGF